MRTSRWFCLASESAEFNMASPSAIRPSVLLTNHKSIVQGLNCRGLPELLHLAYRTRLA